eukprot:3850235-Pyramimonas_sp.AAC.1
MFNDVSAAPTIREAFSTPPWRPDYVETLRNLRFQHDFGRPHGKLHRFLYITVGAPMGAPVFPEQ